MDYIIYAAKPHGTSAFPTVTATTGSPKTLYDAQYDLVFVHVGSGWVPMVQPGSHSIYSGYTSLNAATKNNVITSLTSTSSAPGTAHTTVSTSGADTAIRGR